MFISVYVGAELCWTLFFLLHFSLNKNKKIRFWFSSFFGRVDLSLLLLLPYRNNDCYYYYLLTILYLSTSSFFLFFFWLIIQLWYTIHEWWSIPSYFSFLFPCDLFLLLLFIPDWNNLICRQSHGSYYSRQWPTSVCICILVFLSPDTQ
jgi:hypothetical protein